MEKGVLVLVNTTDSFLVADSKQMRLRGSFKIEKLMVGKGTPALLEWPFNRSRGKPPFPT